MRVLAYTQIHRTFPPVSGIGRHATEILPALAARPGVSVELLIHRDHAGPDGRADPRSPLRSFPAQVIPGRYSPTERAWKLLGRPKIDAHCRGADVVFCPHETYLPLRSVPWVPTIHDVMAFEPDLPWTRTWANRRTRLPWRLWLPAVFRRAARVLTVSEFSKKRMLTLLGVAADRIRVVPNGIGPEFFVPADAPPLSGEPYLITVGGLTVRKGGTELVAVARSLKARNHPLRIAVVGEIAPHLEPAARAVGNIDLLGRLPDVEMTARLRAATALIFLSHYEGFGIPVLEAMAARVPVIAARTSSLPEVVGDAGILVDITDPQAAADAAVQLANSPAERRAWADRGSARATEFTWSAAAARLDAHLREVI